MSEEILKELKSLKLVIYYTMRALIKTLGWNTASRLELEMAYQAVKCEEMEDMEEKAKA